MVNGGLYRVTESGIEFQHSSSLAFESPSRRRQQQQQQQQQGEESQRGHDDAGDPPDDIIRGDFLDQFNNNFEMRILEHPSKNEIVLEFIHVDTSLMNALRRILIAEIPTVAIEHVYMWQNSSIIHDEVLAHRIGLIPLAIDARLLDDCMNMNDDPTDRNTVVFRLDVACSARDKPSIITPTRAATAGPSSSSSSSSTADTNWDESVLHGHEEVEAVAREVSQQIGREGRGRDEDGFGQQRSTSVESSSSSFLYPSDRPYTKHVYSKDLQWVPQGEQLDFLTQSNNTGGSTSDDIQTKIGPIHEDILIAKLRPGQSIELEAHARKGIGKDHAKFSPVATASYRLMPQIELLEDIYDELADELVHVYEPGVFQLVPTNPQLGIDPIGTTRKVQLSNPYACTMSRNYMRHPQLQKAIRMNRIADHFIFSVESVGAYSAAVLVAEAIRTLQSKCQRVMDLLVEANLLQQVD